MISLYISCIIAAFYNSLYQCNCILIRTKNKFVSCNTTPIIFLLKKSHALLADTMTLQIGISTRFNTNIGIDWESISSKKLCIVSLRFKIFKTLTTSPYKSSFTFISKISEAGSAKSNKIRSLGGRQYC